MQPPPARARTPARRGFTSRSPGWSKPNPKRSDDLLSLAACLSGVHDCVYSEVARCLCLLLRVVVVSTTVYPERHACMPPLLPRTPKKSRPRARTPRRSQPILSKAQQLAKRTQNAAPPEAGHCGVPSAQTQPKAPKRSTHWSGALLRDQTINTKRNHGLPVARRLGGPAPAQGAARHPR